MNEITLVYAVTETTGRKYRKSFQPRMIATIKGKIAQARLPRISAMCEFEVESFHRQAIRDPRIDSSYSLPL